MYASALVGFSCPTQEYSRSPRTLTSGDNCDMPLFAHFDASDYPFFRFHGNCFWDISAEVLEAPKPVAGFPAYLKF